MHFFPNLKRIFLLIVVFCSSLAVCAQENHFIYLQTENNQPFYVKMGTTIMSSSSAGYIILPKLKEGPQGFLIGFARSNKPEQKFVVDIEDANKGYLIKDFEEKGYALFDLQSLELVHNTTEEVAAARQPEPAVEHNAFSQMLANVVHDSTILQNNKLPVPPVVLNNKPDKSAIATQVENNKDIIARDTLATAKPAITITKKILSIKEANGMDMIYVDMHDGRMDTIRLFLPGTTVPATPKTIEAKPMATVTYEPQKKPVTDSTLTITTTIIKAPEKNTYIKDTSAKVAEVKQIEIPQPQAIVVISNNDRAVENENKPATDKDSSIDVIRISENSDCKAFATDNDFLKLRKKMAAENNTDEMINVAKKYFKSRCFTTDQIKNLSFLFLNDEGKYRFFDTAYPFTSDSSQYFLLEEQLKDEYYLNRFKAMIHK